MKKIVDEDEDDPRTAAYDVNDTTISTHKWILTVSVVTLQVLVAVGSLILLIFFFSYFRSEKDFPFPEVATRRHLAELLTTPEKNYWSAVCRI